MPAGCCPRGGLPAAALWSGVGLLMVEQQHLIPETAVAVESCWLCGIRVPVRQLVADGGGGCTDVRWYCRDVRGCTARWTGYAARQVAAAWPADRTSGDLDGRSGHFIS